MGQEQLPNSNQQPVGGDFVPQASFLPPVKHMAYGPPEALEAIANHSEAEHFADLRPDSILNLYRTERFNFLAGDKLIPALQDYIDSPDSDIPREDFNRNFSGELSPRGFLLDREGNETKYRPDSIARFRVDPAKQDEALDAAYQQFKAEQKMAEAVDDIEQSADDKFSLEPSELGANSVDKLQQKQAERDKQNEIVIAHFKAYGATDEQIQAYRQDIARMKEAELKRGRLFPHQAGFVHFEALTSAREETDNLDMGVGSGFEQGDRVKVQRTSGKVERQWTFMGIRKDTGLALVARFDEQGRRIYKDYSLDDLKKLNPR